MRINKPKLPILGKFKVKKLKIKKIGHISFWFLTGALLAVFFISSFSYFAFQKFYEGKVYIGVNIGGVDFSQKTEEDVKNYFVNKNKNLNDATFIFSYEDNLASVSAKEIEFGYDENLLAMQTISIGRSKNPISDISIIIQSYINGITLMPSYRYSEQKLDEILEEFYDEINEDPIEAVFNFENGRVTEFKESKNGRTVNKEELNRLILGKANIITNDTSQKVVTIQIPIVISEPTLTTDKVNDLGIIELIGSGTSEFKGSIQNRVFNINLAASRLNGILVEPGEIFSFADAIGDISSYTGYKQAFIISGGKTILGDGGGVCQVSTTLFRSILNSGLPVEERSPHSYRVGYYEQDSLPGLDATVYVPTVDLKFKNDTGNHILIQTEIDLSQSNLTFLFYGTRDGRITKVGEPVISNRIPAPEARYQDDPNLPKGVVKQIDFAAPGASVYFTRTVTKNGETIIEDEFSSNYRPWQAVYLRGTKE